MLSRKERWKSLEEAEEKKNISIADTKQVLEIAATSQLTGRILTLHGCIQIDTNTGLMSKTTATAV